MELKKKSILSTSYNVFKKNIPGWVLLFPALFLFFYLVWRPIFIGITYSFYDLNGFTPVEFVGLKNYRLVLKNTLFLRTLKNSGMYVFWSLIIGLPLPILSAIILNEMISMKQYFKIALYLPAVIPAVANSLLWINIYSGDAGGLLNMFLANFGVAPKMWLSDKTIVIPLIIVSMTWQAFGGTILYYLATLQSVNTELYEATRLDGAGFLQRARHVIIPHLTPIILLMLIKQMIGVFQTLDGPMVMTDGGPNGASTTLALTAYRYAFRDGKADLSLALNVITFFILIWLTFVYFKAEKKFGE